MEESPIARLANAAAASAMGGLVGASAWAVPLISGKSSLSWQPTHPADPLTSEPQTGPVRPKIQSAMMLSMALICMVTFIGSIPSIPKITSDREPCPHP